MPTLRGELSVPTLHLVWFDRLGQRRAKFISAWLIHSFLCVLPITNRCGPCLLMAPEFEAAAKELKGKVRFVKIDTDQEPEMAARLNIMGLPTLLFLDKFEPEEGSTEEAKAVLKDRIEGAIRKDSILALCDHHFFGGPRPEQL